jgi:hypothetical protein
MQGSALSPETRDSWLASALPFIALFAYITMTAIADAFFQLSGAVELLLVVIAGVLIFAGRAIVSSVRRSFLLDSKSRKSPAALQQQNAALRIQLETARKSSRAKGQKVSSLQHTNERLLGELAALKKGTRGSRENEASSDIDSGDDEDGLEDHAAEQALHPLLAALTPRRLVGRAREYCTGAIAGAEQRTRADDLLDRAMRRSRMSAPRSTDDFCRAANDVSLLPSFADTVAVRFCVACFSRACRQENGLGYNG